MQIELPRYRQWLPGRVEWLSQLENVMVSTSAPKVELANASTLGRALSNKENLKEPCLRNINLVLDCRSRQALRRFLSSLIPISSVILSMSSCRRCENGEATWYADVIW